GREPPAHTEGRDALAGAAGASDPDGGLDAAPTVKGDNVANLAIKKLVLAYSGGLDTSVILRWLNDYYRCEVVAFCADIGQAEELEGLEAKALKTGASKLCVVDMREEFARDFVFPILRANAIYEGYYLLGT